MSSDLESITTSMSFKCNNCKGEYIDMNLKPDYDNFYHCKICDTYYAKTYTYNGFYYVADLYEIDKKIVFDRMLTNSNHKIIDLEGRSIYIV